MSLCTALALVFLASAIDVDSPVPRITGLEAWYDIASLHERMRGGERVSTWRDSSGKGHDLTDDENGVYAMFHILQVNDEPAVFVRELNTFSVTTPFELDDHTIFLVYSANKPSRALFQSEVAGRESFGVVLRDKENRDSQLHGRQVIPYSVGYARDSEFNITVLGRESGVLRSFINGRDVSSRAGFAGPIRVGRLFGVAYTRAVRRDGDGVRVAEMIFYNRYLEQSERNSILQYLSRRYGVELSIGEQETAGDQPPVVPPQESAVRARLSTTSSQNVNREDPFAIAWDTQLQIEEPFRHDPEQESTRLYCTRDGTQVRLYLSLPVTGAVSGANVRFLVLKNDQEYQPEEGATGPLAGDEERTVATVVFAATLTLNQGNYVEVVALAQGEPGEIKLLPGQAMLIAEIEEGKENHEGKQRKDDKEAN